MKPILEVAMQAAKKAGDVIQYAARDLTTLNVEEKSLHDYVSEVDRESEQIIAKHIQSVFPEHQILGEEYGERGGHISDYQWVIDPLDGTTNFLRAIPHYAVSIGVLLNGELCDAVVYDPAKEELFTASYGKGSFLNGRAIVVSSSGSIAGALLATGIPFSGFNFEHVHCFTHSMVGLLNKRTSGIRRLGAAALDLAYVAAGRYDGFWEANLKPWDIAAGTLLVTEAGGVVSDLQGGQDYLNSGHIVAANSAVHPEMIEVTCKAYPF